MLKATINIDGKRSPRVESGMSVSDRRMWTENSIRIWDSSSLQSYGISCCIVNMQQQSRDINEKRI